MNTSEDSEMSTSEDSETSASQDSDHIGDENSKVKMCFCNHPAKLRVSHTIRNPFRLFYNCHKYSDNCGFFQWVDEPELTGDTHVDELNLIRNECIRLQGKLEESELERSHDRHAWEREKVELMSKFSTIQTELDEIKKRIEFANESDLMPPIHKLSDTDEDDNVIEIHAM
ncbi:uncharacterized protein LOC126662216 isoform X3 [Mercurialis annua]|nr:uncharacterized protein LOC126662216 isoform X3 [Mercurialis annua]